MLEPGGGARQRRLHGCGARHRAAAMHVAGLGMSWPSHHLSGLKQAVQIGVGLIARRAALLHVLRPIDPCQQQVANPSQASSAVVNLVDEPGHQGRNQEHLRRRRRWCPGGQAWRIARRGPTSAPAACRRVPP